jgi:hypothetical protein
MAKVFLSTMGAAISLMILLHFLGEGSCLFRIDEPVGGDPLLEQEVLL